jgi:hypothetical protein
MTLKVYVAARSLEITRAQKVIESVRGMGCQITFDWPEKILSNRSRWRVTPAKHQRLNAEFDIQGVLAADIFILLHPQKPSELPQKSRDLKRVPEPCTTPGCWVEYGIKLQQIRDMRGRGKTYHFSPQLWVSGPVNLNNVFRHVPDRWFKTDSGTLRALKSERNKVDPYCIG